MFAAYHRVLSKRPILVQCVSTAALFGTGDVIAQQTVEKRGWNNHDLVRTLRMSTFGGIFAGPILSYWYRFIDKTITHKVPSRALLYKVACDQFLFAPFFIGAFFTGQGLFEGKSVNEIKEKLSNGYTTALAGNYKIWPAVQLINFFLLSTKEAAIKILSLIYQSHQSREHQS